MRSETILERLDTMINETLDLMDIVDEREDITSWMCLANREIILKEVVAVIKNKPFDSRDEMWRLIMNTRSHR